MRCITVCRFYFLDTRWLVAVKDSFEDEVYRAWRDGDQRAGTRTVDWWRLEKNSMTYGTRPGYACCAKLRTPTASRGFLKATT